MQNESEKVDRARLAATKWLPMSAVGARHSICYWIHNATPSRAGSGGGGINKHLGIQRSMDAVLWKGKAIQDHGLTLLSPFFNVRLRLSYIMILDN